MKQTMILISMMMLVKGKALLFWQNLMIRFSIFSILTINSVKEKFMTITGVIPVFLPLQMALNMRIPQIAYPALLMSQLLHQKPLQQKRPAVLLKVKREAKRRKKIKRKKEDLIQEDLVMIVTRLAERKWKKLKRLRKNARRIQN